MEKIIIGLLAGLPVWIQTLALIILSFLLYKGGGKLFGFSKKKTSHEGCELHTNHVEEIWKAIRQTGKSFMIKYIYTIKEQENAMIVYQQSIVFLMQKTFNKINKNPTNIRHYAKLLEIMRHRLDKLILEWYAENHLTSRSDLEYEIYIEKKTNFLIEKVTFWLNTEYDEDDYDTTREELSKANFKHAVPEIKIMYRGMFLEARRISEEKESELNKLEYREVEAV